MQDGMHAKATNGHGAVLSVVARRPASSSGGRLPTGPGVYGPAIVPGPTSETLPLDPKNPRFEQIQTANEIEDTADRLKVKLALLAGRTGARRKR
jgi:hypothetical protein